ncbi:MAG: leucyl aminopeptidase family protein [Gammaproteobacteria bacterium]|nr:leucyl aminopeptidase family protein [Gammaproteobacteria bacterium]MBM4210275.1 leucyl aminopeptidase family protein [Gammaproteobacteria bacterium]
MFPAGLELDQLLAPPGAPAIPLWLLRESDLAAFKAAQPTAVGVWLEQHAFVAERHRVLGIPGSSGELMGAVAGLGPLEDWSKLSLWQVSGLIERLPARDYLLATPLAAQPAAQFLLGWLSGGYRLTRFKSEAAAPKTTPAVRARLLPPAGVDTQAVVNQATACAWARDLINAPASALGPGELAEAARALAAEFAAEFRCLVGDDLLAQNYPLVHAVGRASAQAPRLIDIRWGDPAKPLVTLVGKGVCFDSGGLDIKPGAGMLLMKKDMGGAAVALGLARCLMARAAPIRLRVLIPAVENSIAGGAYRPGDILRSRRGITVEIGNTDAEGRLILADALAEADSERPALLLDFATLTGAARVALGPELPAVFSNDDSLAADLQRCGDLEVDPVWPMPLWDSYDEELSSRIADLNNVASSSFAGAIFGALFLRRFVSASAAWAHFDLYAWNGRDRPGRPVGAEAQCLRLADRLIAERFGR